MLSGNGIFSCATKRVQLPGKNLRDTILTAAQWRPR